IRRRYSLELVRADLAVAGVHDHEPPRVDVRQRSQQESVDYAEDGGVRADPKRKGDEGDSRVADVLSQNAKTESHVTQQSLHGNPLSDRVQVPESSRAARMLVLSG